MRDIVILLSTYNGDKFLVQQLESILAQSGVNIHLIVRDDGSSDGTLHILRQYIPRFCKDSTIIEGENIGWKKSFFELIKVAAAHYRNYDFFAFADQDDIWMPEKISRAIESIESSGNGIRLYCSNLFYYKDGINHGLIRNKADYSYKNCLIRNYATGCTAVFNKKLLETMAQEQPEIELPHDYFAYLIAALCGKVIIDHQSFILYRQHDNNQIGCETSFFKRWKRRLISIKDALHSHPKEDLAKEILRLHADIMPPEAVSAVEKLCNYRHSFSTRIRLLFDKGYTFNLKSNDFWLKIRIILGVV